MLFRRMNKTLLFFMLILLFALLSSCRNSFGDGDEGENETKISRYNSEKSHNAGENCISCHKEGGEGDGWFSAAGTVYDSLLKNTYPNAVIKLYTQKNGNGNIVKIIEVDRLGNFYTTENIDFSSGLFAAVEGRNVIKYMQSSVETGQCGSCHGAKINRIWVK